MIDQSNFEIYKYLNMIFLIWCKVSNYFYIWHWKFNIIQHNFNRMITVWSQWSIWMITSWWRGSLVISRCELLHFEMKWFKTVLLMASNRAIKIIHFKIFTINFNRSRGCNVIKSWKLKFSKNHDFENLSINDS